ncbi:MAG: hypothetical protein KDA51_11445, partial [Planctomycetales bacterium]|nr:hypothetical protein [Planctomycetales bacterium]
MTTWDEIDDAKRSQQFWGIFRLACALFLMFLVWNHFRPHRGLVAPSGVVAPAKMNQLGVEQSAVATHAILPEQEETSPPPLRGDDSQRGFLSEPAPAGATVPTTSEPTRTGVNDTQSGGAQSRAEPGQRRPQNDDEFGQSLVNDTLEAIAAVKEKLEQQVSLANVGGPEGQEVSELLDRVANTSDYLVASNLADRSLRILMESAPRFQWRQLQLDLNQSTGEEQSAKLLQFWRAYPSHERISDVMELMRQ